MEGHSDNAGHGAKHEPPFPRKYDPTRLSAFKDFVRSEPKLIVDDDFMARAKEQAETLDRFLTTDDERRRAAWMLRGLGEN